MGLFVRFRVPESSSLVTGACRNLSTNLSHARRPDHRRPLEASRVHQVRAAFPAREATPSGVRRCAALHASLAAPRCQRLAGQPHCGLGIRPRRRPPSGQLTSTRSIFIRLWYCSPKSPLNLWRIRRAIPDEGEEGVRHWFGEKPPSRSWEQLAHVKFLNEPVSHSRW